MSKLYIIMAFEIILVLLWIGIIIYNIINTHDSTKLSNSENNNYSAETLEISARVINDISTRKIKKHILTDNTTKEVNSKQMLDNYKNFLKTELFQEIKSMN